MKKGLIGIISLLLLFTIGCNSNENRTEVERVSLDWNKLHEGTTLAEGVEVPKGYKMSTALDDYIQLSRDSYSESVMTEDEMNDFIVQNYLPSDVEFIGHEKVFEERQRANGSDTENSIYTYKSDASALNYTIEFSYYYDKNGSLSDTYDYVVIEK